MDVSWTIPEWCALVKISRSTFYRLKVAPRTVKFGALRRVVENPVEWLRRVGES
jgi:predicted DNA-binding transcriptional regulator AlpA